MVWKLLSCYQNLPITAKAAVWFTFGNLVLKGIGLFSAPLFSRLLSADEYGRLMIFMASQQIILILATWEMPIGAYMRGLFKYKDDIGNYTAATLGLSNLLTIICFFGVWLFDDAIFSMIGMPVSTLWTLFAYLMVFPAYQCWMVQQRVNDFYRRAVAMTVFYGFVCVAMPVLSVLHFGRTAEIKYIGTLAAGGCISLLFYVPYMRASKLRRQWQRVRQYWEFNVRFQGPAVLHSLSYLILGQSDRIMIGAMIAPKEAAYYSVAYTLAQSFSLFQSSILQALLPWQYKQLEKKNLERIKSVNSTLRCCVIAGIFLFEMGAPEVLRFLFTKDYYEAIWCIPPIAASLYFLFLYSMFVNVEEYFEKTRYVMYVSVSCSVFNICANYIALPVFGYLACAYTTLLSYMLFAVGHFIFTRRVICEYLGLSMRELFPGTELILQGMAMLALSLGSLCLYPYPIVRYGIIIIALIAVYRYRQGWQTIYQDIKKGK